MACATSLAAPSATAEERKTVTTLFCDLVGFTAMSEAADPEEVDALLRAYFARATSVIESHGGVVEKFIGDAVVGVFGVPVVHEDDAERAVRAGLASSARSTASSVPTASRSRPASASTPASPWCASTSLPARARASSPATP